MAIDLIRKSAANVIAKECLASRVRFLNRVVSSVYDHALRPLGITINQLNMLVAVSQIQEATARKLGAFLQMDPSTISRNLERMRKAGWIQSRPGEDARSVQLRVTPSGSRKIERALPFWQQAQSRAQELMGSSNILTLLQLSKTMK